MRIGLKSILFAAIANVMPLTAQAQVYNRPGWGYGDDWGWGFGHMAFGGLMMVLFWGGIILLIVLAVRWLGAGPHGNPATHPQRKTPREILEERFAHGEIDKEEFEERRRTLRG
jgi:putative membrane protein